MQYIAVLGYNKSVIRQDMVKEIIQIGDPILLETSREVEVDKIASAEIQNLAKDILDTTKSNVDSAAGLSAVQIGVLKRIYVVKRTDLDNEVGEYEVLINPEITNKSKAKEITWEGCMSISDGKERLFGPVSRPKEIRVDYYNLSGEKRSLNAKGFFSHLLQHEQDHLNGVLFLSYIDNPKNIWKESELDEYLQEYGTFPQTF